MSGDYKVLGDIPTSMDARPVLAEFRANESNRIAKEKADPKREWVSHTAYKVGDGYKTVSEMSDVELLEVLKREHIGYTLLTLIPLPSEQQRINPTIFAGVTVGMMLLLTVLIQETITVAAWVLRGFR